MRQGFPVQDVRVCRTVVVGDFAPLQPTVGRLKALGSEQMSMHSRCKPAERAHTQAQKTLTAAVPPLILFKSIEPQPGDLPAGWEQALAISETLGTVVVFRHLEQKIVQQSDPRPPPDDKILPEGWTQEFDEDGDPYYVDHNSLFATYDDPRTISVPLPSKVLSVHKPKTRTSIKSKKTWKLGPRDLDTFSKMDNYLTMPEEIPECVRNKKYNRYMDILPNPKTAVPLDEIDGEPESTYINANFVRGYDGDPKAYIAAMGPKPLTLTSFWRMIFQHNVSAIIMLTGLVEKGKTKCERYWPSVADGKSELKFGTITVTAHSTVQETGFAVTLLRATDASTGKTHKVIHFWFQAWPDHGVPKNSQGEMTPDELLEMLRHVHKFLKGVNHGPILVHCSAGIGRTGTIIAIDHALQALEKEREADCLKIIDSIRHDRCAMVQHLQQFEFVVEACIRHAEKCKVVLRVEGEDLEGPSAPRGRTFSPEQAKEIMQQEKASARARAEKAVGRGHRGSLMTKSQMHGELRLAARVEGEVLRFLDLDGDGVMSPEEARLQGMSMARFREIDANADGVISVEEFKAYIAEHGSV
eukprot:m.22546 g.22546  ORF g.22546 m.22546 type:complete len:584 (+) comp6858_c0_seq2:548-2299(+)